MINLPVGVNKIQSLMQEGEQYYLVGGTVRDALLSRSSQDVDITCSGDVKTFARRFADQVSGSFFMLDEERKACRVIARNGEEERLVFDFTAIRGNRIIDDLHERDFTINAMAVDLRDPETVIDPLGGGRDLVEKWLRPCSPTAFIDDPLRVIRAFRYSVNYDLRIEPQTLSLLQQSVDRLAGVSHERKRDELFKILDKSKPWVAFSLFEHSGVLPYISMGSLVDIRNAISRLKNFYHLTSYLVAKDFSQEQDSFLLSSIIAGFKHSRENLRDHLLQVNSSDRSKISLDGLICLFWQTDIHSIENLAQDFALSKDELDQVMIVLQNRDCVTGLISNGSTIDQRSIYKFFNRMGGAGIDLLLLALADVVNCPAAEINSDLWLKRISVSQQLVECWFERKDVVDPKPFLTGRDLMFEFDLVPGPLIGQLLDGLKEEQAAGNIKTRQSALDWIEGRLQPGF